MATLSATFHRRVVASAGLSLSLSRPSTVGPRGEAVSADEPVFDVYTAVAGPPESADITTVGTGARPASFAGLAANGTDPRNVQINNGPGTIFFTFGAPNATAQNTKNITSGSGVVPFRDGTTLRTPRAGCIAHGAAIVVCRRSVDGVTEGISVCATTDDGANWSVLIDDATIMSGIDRVERWAAQNAYVRERGSGPLEFFFPVVDYGFQSSTTAGVCLLVRATRPNTSTAWSFTAARIGVWESPFSVDHLHSAGMVFLRDGSGTITHARVVVARGDGTGKSGLTALTIPIADIDSGDWTTIGNWTKDDDYHGLSGTNALRGFQPVGMAPGPDLSTLLMGSDVDSAGIVIVDCTGDKAVVRSTSVLGTRSNYSGSEIFSIRVADPADPHRFGWVAYYNPAFNTDSPGNGNRLYGPRLYSKDGISWAEVLTGYNFTSSGNTSVVCDGVRIISLRNDATDTTNQGLGWRNIPTMVRRRPLRVGSGGVNRLVASPSVSAQGTTDVTTPSEIPEGLPCLGPVYRVTRSASGSGTTPLVLMTMSTGGFPAGPVSGRIWVRNATDGLMTIGLSETITNGAGSFASNTSGLTTIPQGGQWYPLTFNGDRTSTSDFRLTISCDAEQDFDAFLALDTLYAADTLPGFAVAPDTTAAHERAALTWTPAGDDAITAYFSVKLPRDGIDQSWTQGTIPLVCLWEDDNNYLAVEIDMAAENLVFRAVRGGSPSTATIGKAYPWRGHQIVGAITWNGGTGRAACTAAAGGLPIATAQITSLASGFDPAQLRFGYRTTADETASLLALDAQVIDATAVADATAVTAVKGLTFAQSVPDPIEYRSGVVSNNAVVLRVRVEGIPPTSPTVPGTITVTGSTSGAMTATLDSADIEPVGFGVWEIVLTMTLSGFAVEGETLTLSADAGAILADPDYESVAFDNIPLSNITPPASLLPRCTTLSLGVATSEAPGDVAWGSPENATDGDPLTAATAILDPGQTTQDLTSAITLGTEIRDLPTPILFTIRAQRELEEDILNIISVKVVNNDGYDSDNLLAAPITPVNGLGDGAEDYFVGAWIPGGELAPLKEPKLKVKASFVSGVGSRLFVFDLSASRKVCAGGNTGGGLGSKGVFKSSIFRSSL